MSETTTPTPRLSKDEDQAIGHLHGIAEFAYENGFHELGYDPIDFIKNALLSRASTPVNQKVRGALEAIRGESCHNYSSGVGACYKNEHENDCDNGAGRVCDSCRAAEALTLLAPDTRTEYDKAVEALAPYLPDGWVCQDPNGSTERHPLPPYIKNDGMWLCSAHEDLGESNCGAFELTDTMTIPRCEDWRTSLRQIKSGKVVPHV